MQCPPPFEWPADVCAPRAMRDPCDLRTTRETREFIYELKFYVAGDDAEALMHWARSHLSADPHGAGPHGDSYRVSSIYFDTASHDVLARQGSFARCKYRVRRYGDSELVYLERKTRGACRVFKRRSALAVAALPALLATQPARGWSGYWFHRRLLARRLAAVNRVEYQRIARIGQSSHGPLRLTLDQDLTAWPARELAFARELAAEGPAGGVRLSGERLILELKFGQAMPAVFKRLIREFAPRLSGISKYRLAAQALGLGAPLAGPSPTGAASSRESPLVPLVPVAY